MLTEADQVIGFFVLIDQGLHQWVDDLCLSEPRLWQEAVRTLSSQARAPWITCTSAFHTVRHRGLETAGATRVSTYFARKVELGEVATAAATSAHLPTDYERSGPPHTFGGSPFSSATPGALVLADEEHGYVIGSPSASPPLFDPGGPTCVIDQVVGPERSWLVEQALGQAERRGDAQVIVVCAEHDQELASVLLDLEFKAVVHVYRMG